jgi:hypothetical protein
MRSERLFIFRGFTHDLEGVLAAVHRLALVRLELLLNGSQKRRSERGYGAELHIAVLANAKLRRFTDDPKFSLLCHTPSLRRSLRRSTPVEIKRHHGYNGRLSRKIVMGSMRQFDFNQPLSKFVTE